MVFETMMDLRANPTTPQPEEVITLLGYWSAGDEGGGDFYWDNTSVVADNGGTIIQQNNLANGRWKRIYTDYVSISWFGARCDANLGTGNGTNDAAAIQAAVNASPYVRGKGNTRISSPILFTHANANIDFVNLQVVTDGNTAFQLGDASNKVNHSLFNFGEIFGSATGDDVTPTYTNSGILVKNSIQSRIYAGSIMFFENGVDFYPGGVSMEDGISAAENYVYASISRCINGVRLRKTGSGTQDVNPRNRGWCEGNVLDGGIFGCDKGLYIEQDALATFTKLEGLTIDCFAGANGAGSETSLDIDARIYNAIVGDAKFLRVGKSVITQAVTSKISAIPIDQERLLSENLCLNPLFLTPSIAGSGVFGWNATAGTLTRNADGSVRFTLSQPGQPGGGLDGRMTTNPAALNGKYFSIYFKSRMEVASPAAAIVYAVLIILDASNNVKANVVLGQKNITNQANSYSDVYFSARIPSNVQVLDTDNVIIRLTDPQSLYPLDVKECQAWLGYGNDHRILTRKVPDTYYGETVPVANSQSVYWFRGDRIVNIAASASGDTLSWVCTQSGNVGTWKIASKLP
jgi:hypothetical protein